MRVVTVATVSEAKKKITVGKSAMCDFLLQLLQLSCVSTVIQHNSKHQSEWIKREEERERERETNRGVGPMY